MPLNILQHKDWNVWNKDNIAKVEADKKKFQEEQDAEFEKDRNRAAADRYEKLFDRASKNKTHMIGFSGTGQSMELQAELDPRQHINFFRDAELNEKRENPEVVAERKLQEKKDRNELGNSSVEATKVKPWYEAQAKTEPEKLLKQQLKKIRDDPLQNMNKLLGDTKKRLYNVDEEQVSAKRQKPLELQMLDPPLGSDKSEKGKWSKKDKKSKKSKKKSIEELRKERLEREAKERHKTQQLLAPAPVVAVPQGRYSGLSSYSGYTGVRSKQ